MSGKNLDMAKQVIKRGGKKAPFKAEKIRQSIKSACKDAHISAARAKKVVAKVSGPVLRFAAKRKVVSTAVLRRKVLAGLKRVEPVAVKTWLKHDKRRRARRR